MTEPEDRPGDDDEAHARPYRPEDFTKLQYVPPTHFQRAVAKLKIIGALTGLLIVVALCARVVGIA
jgi:hypothetical protein